MQEEQDKLGKALLKVALGYQVSEVTEEYAEVDGALKLLKRKKTKKDIPPDLKAVQLLLSSENSMATELMTDEQLEEEKARLIALLQAEENASGVTKSRKTTGQVCDEENDKALNKVKKPRAKPRKRVVRKTKKESKESKE